MFEGNKRLWEADKKEENSFWPKFVISFSHIHVL